MTRGDTTQRKSRRHRWTAILGLAILLSFVCLAITSRRRAIAEHFILAGLRHAGIGDATVVVARLGWSALQLRDLRVGRESDLSIETIEARYSVARVLAGQLDSLRVSGVRLSGSIASEGLSFGALDALFERESDSNDPAFPVAAITVEDVRVDLETPYGSLDISVMGRATSAREEGIRAQARLTMRHAVFIAHGYVNGRGAPDSRRGVEVKFTARGKFAPGFAQAEADISLAGRLSFREGLLNLRLGVPSRPFALTVASDEEPLRVKGDTPHVRLRVQRADANALRVRIRTTGGRVLAPDYGIEARGLALSLELDPPTRMPKGRIQVAELLDTTQPERFLRLALDGHVTPHETDLTVAFTVADPDHLLAVDATGRHNFARGVGAAELRLHPLLFEPDGLQPSDLVPAFRGTLSAVSGSLEAIGSIEWEDTRITSGLDLAIHEFSMSTNLANLERVNAAIHIDGPSPVSTPPGQLLSMARLDFGLELTDGLIAFRLRPDGTVDLETTEWRFAGGLIHTAGNIDPAAEEQDIILSVEELRVADLLALVDLDGLSGSGVLHGKIPLTHRGGTTEIHEAVLTTGTEGGWLRYQPDERTGGLAVSDQGLDVLFEALEDFRYETLELTLNGDTNGVVKIHLNLRGFNPALQSGRPVVFNLNLEAMLTDLLSVSTAAYRVPQTIEERFREWSPGSP